MESDSGSTNPIIEQYNRYTLRFFQLYQTYLDKSTPHFALRWIGTIVLILLFMTRIIIAQGWYIIAYGLGIYLLNMFLAFLTPKFDPSLEQEIADDEAESGQSNLPTRANDEFRPFIRRLPEFKFWLQATRATSIAFVMTFIPIFDIPVFCNDHHCQ